MSYFHSLASRVVYNGSPKWIKESEGLVKEVPLFAILTRKLLSNFFPWVLVSIWVQLLKKTACYRPLKNQHFVRVCMEKIKTARETYIQTIIRWELMLNTLQINQKSDILSTFPSSNRRNFDDSGKVLALSVSEIYQSIAVQFYQPKLIKWLSLLYVYK